MSNLTNSPLHALRHWVAPAALLLLLLTGCGETATPTETPTVAVTSPVAVVTSTATRPSPTATPTPTRTPTPQPPTPQIELNPQPIAADGEVVVARVVALEAGWLALSSDDRLLAAAPVAAGTTQDLVLTVDPLAVGADLTAQLYAGRGREFDTAALAPATDGDGEPVSATADVTVQAVVPVMRAGDQRLAADGVLTVAAVTAAQDGWLRVYNDDGGAFGTPVGLLFVPAGTLENLQIALDWRVATPRLHVALHADLGRPGRFDAADDPLVAVQGSPVAVAIDAVFPPDVYVLDQPVLNDQVVIERVISYGPGWLTIRVQNDDEQAGNIIGYAALADGVNERVVVDLARLAATPIVYAQLHNDVGDIGVFEFPASDPVVQYDAEMYLFPFATDRGNYVVSADQPIAFDGGTASVVVPLAVSDLSMWVTVRADENGRIGDVLGYQWVPAGINRNVRVEIIGDSVTPILHAVLHVDVDQPQVFEYPDGRDFELQRRRAPIDAPFLVLEP